MTCYKANKLSLLVLIDCWAGLLPDDYSGCWQAAATMAAPAAESSEAIVGNSDSTDKIASQFGNACSISE